MAKFVRGQKKPMASGRKRGVPNKKTLEVRAIARDLLDEAYFDALKFRLKAGTAAPGVETLIHHYAFGKPKETVTFQEDPRLSVQAFRRLAS